MGDSILGLWVALSWWEMMAAGTRWRWRAVDRFQIDLEGRADRTQWLFAVKQGVKERKVSASVPWFWG